MQFTPMSDQEIQENALLADGQYKAQLWEAIDKDSRNNPLLTKNGDEKIQIICHVFDDKDRPRKVTGMVTTAYMKLFKHFCDALGLEKEYKEGHVTALDCKKKDSVVFGVQIGRRMYTKENGEVVWSNQIEDFIKLDSSDHSKDFDDKNISF